MSLTIDQIKTKARRTTKTNSATWTDADLIADVNLAQDEVFAEALKSNGWNVDDFNQTDYPIIYTNLVAGQRDYTFIYDEQGNLILDIYKVQIMDQGGTYHDIRPVDQQVNTNMNAWGTSPVSPTTMTDGQNSTGLPTTYDKTGNGIFLDLIPSYNKTAGLRVFVDREMTYFTTADTTKVSGIDGLCHDYLYLKPAYEYARDNGLENKETLFRDLQIAWKKIQQRYGKREKDVPNRMTPAYQSNK
jgi:hypothetical protein